MIWAVVAIVLVFLFLYISRDSQKYPPGPWNLPIIGYLHKLDPESPYLTLTKLVQKYGPIFKIKFGFVNIVVIGEAKLLKKILIKEETLGRPPFFMLQVASGGKGLALDHLSVWKDQRKLTSNFLRTAGAAKFSSNKKRIEDLITNCAKNFVCYVKSQGKSVTLNPSEAVVHYVSSVTGALILGKSFSRDDKIHTNLVHNIDILQQLAQFAGPLNFLPFLRFLPKYSKTLTTFRSTLDKTRKILGEYINECEQSFSNDSSASNLIEAFLLQGSKAGAAEIYNTDQLIGLSLDVFGAGTETTVNSILWTMYYLAQYQTVQDKVRQELFAVLHDKTLEMSDLLKLSYTQATITEVARIKTIVPLGVPHYAAEDIYVDDMKICKGTTVIPLLWAIHMDPNVWDKPEEFRPERFLNEEKTFVPSESVLPFSCGKRMCVGDELARMMIYQFVASLLKNFKIEPSDNCPIDFSGVCGATLVPKPQKIVFVKI